MPTIYLAGRYNLETLQTEDPKTGRVVKQATLFCTYLTADEAKKLFSKDKYNTPLFSKLGFRSMFHESNEREQREQLA